PPHPPLTLIVATTPIPTPNTSKISLGIGLHGTLPWPRIKSDMSFFARVTSRPPHPGTTNAIIMGRKTYDSVPANLRPLVKRINTVITRDVESVGERVRRELEERRKRLAAAAAAAATGGNGGQPETDAIVCGGLEEAVQELEGTYAERLGKVFVIGGAEIYKAALGVQGKVRIVMTNVEKLGYREKGDVFECDTFFPVDEELLEEKGWRQASAEEVTEWVGETVTGEWKEEGEVRIQMVGYER
ncbi:dihydrofolate reductase, partial [Aspergillus sclerotiicarbonarius CBS 121057]